jgi:protoheme IX farnesyltransferase
MRVKDYYALTKPGIIYGNVMTATAGYLLASRLYIHFELFVATLAGTSIVIASACVINNYIDRNIDKKMARTKKRALVTGLIPAKNAIVFAVVLAFVGFFLLAAYTNFLVTIVGAVAFVVYVVLYGISKRRSVHGTIVGSFSGAAPVLAGYLAARGHFDSGALIVFLILVVWQMSHFYAIAMYRFDDYRAAKIPVLPVKKGMQTTKIQILLYVIGFMVSCALLTIYDYTGYTYLVVMLLFGLAWLRYAMKGFGAVDDSRWARKMFLLSLIGILALSIMMPLGTILP